MYTYTVHVHGPYYLGLTTYCIYTTPTPLFSFWCNYHYVQLKLQLQPSRLPSPLAPLAISYYMFHVVVRVLRP